MRRGVVPGSVLALVLVLPAAARHQDETVTVLPAKSVALKTVFDRNTRYTVTVSGIVTFTVSGTPITYDPLFSFRGGSCQNASPGVGVRILSGGTDVFSPFSTRPAPTCRSDHTYTFTLNGPAPSLAGVLSGRVTAKNTLAVNAARGDTATGSFRLVIKAGPPERVATVLWGVQAHEKKGLVAETHLTGRGLMETTEIKEGGLADTAYLLPTETTSGETPHADYVSEGVRRRHVDMAITSGQLVIQGAADSREERFSVRLIVEVVDSNKPGCAERSKTRRGARGKLTLVYYPSGAPDRFVNAVLDLPCGVDESWKDEDSDATIRVERVKKKRY